jgi:DNA-binding CsgD family transcriptional regulator
MRMYFLDTEMHMVTFSITIFELIMLCFQIFYFLQRTSDQKRLLYLILLVLLILYNVCSGFLPDKDFVIPIAIQNVVAYLVAFSMSMYFVYYFYKAFELKHLRFFATYGSIFFLLLPFLFLFVLPYYLTGNLELSRRLTVVIPFLYGLVFLAATTRAFVIKFKERAYTEKAKYQLVIAAYLALLCWLTLPVIVFFGDFQALEHSITNAGFLILTIVYVKSSIHESRREYTRLLVVEQTRQQLIEQNCLVYNLSSREIEIVRLLVRGQPYKIIGAALKISEKTVGKHVSNIFAKVGVTNKVELTYKLESRSRENEV